MSVPTFASCTFLLHHTRDGRIDAARAGHIPLVWASGDDSHGALDLSGGPVLGVVADAEFPTRNFTLPYRSVLALITDGLVEGPARSLDTGLARLSALVAETLRQGLGPQETADRLLASARAVGHEDDAALLVLRRP